MWVTTSPSTLAIRRRMAVSQLCQSSSRNDMVLNVNQSPAIWFGVLPLPDSAKVSILMLPGFQFRLLTFVAAVLHPCFKPSVQVGSDVCKLRIVGPVVPFQRIVLDIVEFFRRTVR